MTHHDLNKMILQTPMCHSWMFEDGSPGSFNEDPIFDFPENLSTEWKVLACIIAYNKVEILPNYRTFERVLGIQKKELQKAVKLLKEGNRISILPTVSERTGLLCGSGFFAE